MKLRCVISFALGAATAATVCLGTAVADRIPQNLSLSGLSSISDLPNLSSLAELIDPDALDGLASAWLSYRGEMSSGDTPSDGAATPSNEKNTSSFLEGAANLRLKAVQLYDKVADAVRSRYAACMSEQEEQSEEQADQPQNTPERNDKEQINTEIKEER